MKFYYRLKGANGEVMMHSEVRENKKSCALRDVKRTVLALAANMDVVKVVDCTAFPPEVIFEKSASNAPVIHNISGVSAWSGDRPIVLPESFGAIADKSE